MEQDPAANQGGGEKGPIDWNYGLFSCLDEIGLCCMTCIVPCVTFGNLAEAMGEDCMMYGAATMVPLLNFYCFVTMRGRVREKYGIEGSLVNDILSIWCCGICALVQTARQAKIQPGQEMQRH